jgi:thymidylate synthase
MNTSPFIIEETNLSKAWARTVKRIVDSPGYEITPFVLTLTGFEESKEIRQNLDVCLKQDKMGSVRTVSETIFPESLYRLCDKNRFHLYEEYKRNLPRIKAIDPRSNGRGTYFERLIAYQGKKETINQLEIIISSIKNRDVKRRSKLQASIFDPGEDHTKRPFQGFPCLQHITFSLSSHGGLILNSFYAIQYLYRRAYGNWLGLINLGKFVSNELELELERFNCFIGIEQLDHIKKPQARKFLAEIGTIMSIQA